MDAVRTDRLTETGIDKKFRNFLKKISNNFQLDYIPIRNGCQYRNADREKKTMGETKKFQFGKN